MVSEVGLTSQQHLNSENGDFLFKNEENEAINNRIISNSLQKLPYHRQQDRDEGWRKYGPYHSYHGALKCLYL